MGESFIVHRGTIDPKRGAGGRILLVISLFLLQLLDPYFRLTHHSGCPVYEGKSVQIGSLTGCSAKSVSHVFPRFRYDFISRY